MAAPIPLNPSAIQAIAEVWENLQETETPPSAITLTAVNRLSLIGKTYPSLQQDTDHLLKSLASRSLEEFKPSSTNEEIHAYLQGIKTILADCLHDVTDTEFELLLSAIREESHSKVASRALDFIIEHADLFIHDPLSFAMQVQSLRSFGELLTHSQENIIFSFLFQGSAPPSGSHEQGSLEPEKFAKLREVAKTIYQRADVKTLVSAEKSLRETAVESSWELVETDEINIGSFETLADYKMALASLHENFRVYVLENSISTPSGHPSHQVQFDVPAREAFAAALFPSEEALLPSDPEKIPHQFDADYLTNQRSTNKIVSFPSSEKITGTPIEFPSTREEGLLIVAEAEQFARSLLPPNTGLDEIYNMRNCILAFSTQHLPNAYVMPLKIEANQFLGDRTPNGILQVHHDLTKFDVVKKDGVIQPGQFKVSFDSYLNYELIEEGLTTDDQVPYIDQISPPVHVKVEFIVDLANETISDQSFSYTYETHLHHNVI